MKQIEKKDAEAISGGIQHPGVPGGPDGPTCPPLPPEIDYPVTPLTPYNPDATAPDL